MCTMVRRLQTPHSDTTDQQQQHLVVRCKPVWSVLQNPYAAIQNCHDWAHRTGMPCDGVVFIDCHISVIFFLARVTQQTTGVNRGTPRRIASGN